MPKSITRIVLTGGPAAGKTTLISRILKEFEAQGLVRLERGRIQILDRDRLMRLAWPREPL